MKSDSIILFPSAFLLSLPYFAYPSLITKVLPIYFLALFPLIPGASARFNVVSIGLLLSSVGDIALQLGDDGLYFIGGLAFFLMAHVAYIIFFYHSNLQISSFAIFCIFAVTLLYILLPNIGSDLKLPVIVYALVIATMGGMSLSRFWLNKGSDYLTSLYGVLGAGIFLISDTILALNKFYSPFSGAQTFVMITYYIGQTLIAASNHTAVKTSKMKA